MLNDYVCLGCSAINPKDELLDDGNTCPECGSDELAAPHEFQQFENTDTCKVCGESEAMHEDD